MSCIAGELIFRKHIWNKNLQDFYETYMIPNKHPLGVIHQQRTDIPVLLTLPLSLTLPFDVLHTI